MVSEASDLTDPKAREELSRAPAAMSAAVLGGIAEDQVTVAVVGDRATIAADGESVCVATSGRTEPVVHCVRLSDVESVEARVRGDHAVLHIALRDGPRLGFESSAAQREETMQAATVLNLLVAQARRHAPSGIGVAAARGHWRDRVRRTFHS